MRGGASVAIGILIALCFPVSSQAAAPETTAAQAASAIMAARGRPAIVVIMKSSCGRCRAFLPVFSKFVGEEMDRRVRVIVFSLDKTKETLDTYLDENRLSFDISWIPVSERSGLPKEFQPTGVRIGSNFGLPLVSVLDAKGKSLGQWEGMTNSADVARIGEALNGNAR